MSIPRPSCRGLCHTVTILLSAFLVFQVQPVISKLILPWFGGTPAVWTTCMLFFQVALFAGYAYAHASIRLLRPAQQGLLHLGLIFAALALLPILPDASWKPAQGSHPTWDILALLAASVGFPYFVLSATGPLVQAWFSRTCAGQSPYRLYALSNAGSLAALVSYPFLVEPALATTAQAQLWSVGFAVFALFCGFLALRIWNAASDASDTNSAAADNTTFVAADNTASATADNGATDSPTDMAPTWTARLAWLALAACASLMLLATTNHVCQDVAVVPFLWVAPLAFYLVSFIICFEKEHWYSRRWFGLGAAVWLLLSSLLVATGGGMNLLLEVVVHFTALFFVCMVCHGELIRRKPAPRHLTSFYLMSAAGGALGGVLVAVVAPLVFSTYLEFKLGLVASFVLAIVVAARDSRAWFQGRPRFRLLAGGMACAALLLVFRCQTASNMAQPLQISRSFFGVLSVDDVDTGTPKHGHALRYGRILHGFQFLAADRRQTPTLYFDKKSGIGLALANVRQPNQRPGRRIGLVGLGVGTLAAYGKPGDYLRFYEINPDVLRVANDYFSYLQDCPGKVEVVLGDARLSLEREPPQRFDVLALDAFSGDAIPAHLLTQEAFAVYGRHLQPGGLLAIHITNRHVDLDPVVRGLAAHAGYELLRIQTKTRLEEAATASTWMLLSKDRELLATQALREAATPAPRHYAKVPLWTDDYSNLFQILR